VIFKRLKIRTSDRPNAATGPGEALAMEDQPLWDNLVRSLKDDFPNTQRQGCPQGEILHLLAIRELKLGDARQWLHHLGSCSACYNEFLALSHQAKRRFRMRALAIAAALLLACVALVTWNRNQGERDHGVRTAVLDLRNYSTLRTAESPGRPAEQPLVASRNATEIILYLPLGSIEDTYEVEVQDVETQRVILRSSGIALIKDHATVFQTKLNLPELPVGNYLFALRKTGTAWSKYRLVLH
jgi:hypothetical protein